MKNSIIKELFYNISKCQKGAKVQSDNKQYISDICDIEEKLKSQLSAEQFELLQQILFLLDENNYKEIASYFIQGFKLGLLTGIECFEDN